MAKAAPFKLAPLLAKGTDITVKAIITPISPAVNSARIMRLDFNLPRSSFSISRSVSTTMSIAAETPINPRPVTVNVFDAPGNNEDNAVNANKTVVNTLIAPTALHKLSCGTIVSKATEPANTAIALAVINNFLDLISCE